MLCAFGFGTGVAGRIGHSCQLPRFTLQPGRFPLAVFLNRNGIVCQPQPPFVVGYLAATQQFLNGTLHMQPGVMLERAHQLGWRVANRVVLKQRQNVVPQ